ncbi:hypothetical protein SCUP515_04711 [Seiridium cupressi]
MSDDAIYQLGAHGRFAARDDEVMNHRLVGIFRNNYHDNEDDNNGQSDPGAVVILLEALIMTYLGQFLDGRSSEHHPTCSFELSRTLRQGLDLAKFSLQSLNSAWSVQQADTNCIFSLLAAFEEVAGRLIAIEDHVYIDYGKTQATSVICWYAEFSKIDQLDTTDLTGPGARDSAEEIVIN